MNATAYRIASRITLGLMMLCGLGFLATVPMVLLGMAGLDAGTAVVAALVGAGAGVFTIWAVVALVRLTR